jgi:hypothetical protein
MARPHHRTCGSAYGGSSRATRITPIARCDPWTMPQAPHASQRKGTYRRPRPYGCHRCRYPFRGRMPADQFSPSRASRLPVSSFSRAITHPRLAGSLLWPLLTSRGISSSGSPQVRARCFPARPPHFPPRRVRPSGGTSATGPGGFAVWCQLAASRRPWYAVSVRRPAGFP